MEGLSERPSCEPSKYAALARHIRRVAEFDARPREVADENTSSRPQECLAADGRLGTTPVPAVRPDGPGQACGCRR